MKGLTVDKDVLTIHEVIAATVSDKPNRTAVKQLVELSHRVALAYLKQKMRRGRLQPERFGLSLQDLALDCLADLFQRDQSGRFILLISYFDSVNWNRMDEPELQISLRRLIFSKVNEGLFRRYREIDSNLAKIIRNLKNAVRTVPGVELVRRENALWLVADAKDCIRPLPLIPPEVLEAYVITCSGRLAQVQQGVRIFLRFVREYPTYCNAYPLTAFAQTLREAIFYLEDATWSDQEDDVSFLSGEIDKAIVVTVQAVKSSMYASYVDKGKVDGQTFNAYFYAIQDVLAGQFVSGAPEISSYYAALREYVPDLDKNTYHDRHRNIIEYLAKLTRAELVRYLRDEG